MIDLTPNVYNLLITNAELLTLLGNNHIYYNYPQNEPAETDFPIITFQEVENVPDEADGEEWAAFITMSIDIFHTSSPIDIALKIDDIMTTADWERTGSTDIVEADVLPILYHKSLKYEIYVEKE